MTLTAAADELLEGLGGALERAARRGRRTLASATIEVEGMDPSALVLASRLASDRWFCWEQPDAGGFALATLGSVREVVSRGDGRFADLERDCTELIRDAESSEPAGLVPGAGPVWTGGFAFDPDGGAASQWSSLPPALMVMPELSLVRADGRCFLTANAVLEDGEAPTGRGRRFAGGWPRSRIAPSGRSTPTRWRARRSALRTPRAATRPWLPTPASGSGRASSRRWCLLARWS